MADKDSNNDTFVLNEDKLVIDSDLKFYTKADPLTTSNFHHRKISSRSGQQLIEMHVKVDHKKF